MPTHQLAGRRSRIRRLNGPRDEPAIADIQAAIDVTTIDRYEKDGTFEASAAEGHRRQVCDIVRPRDSPLARPIKREDGIGELDAIIGGAWPSGPDMDAALIDSLVRQFGWEGENRSE